MLGVSEDNLYPQQRIELAPGEALIALSGGARDALYPPQQERGMDAVAAVLNDQRCHSADELLETICRLIDTYPGVHAASDRCIVAVRRGE